MSEAQINERTTQLNQLISENKFPEAIEVLAIINESLNSKTLEDQTLNLRGRYQSLKQLIISGTADNEETMQEENKLRMAFSKAKDLMLDIYKNGEISVQPEPAPVDAQVSAIAGKPSFIDYAIVGLSSLVFIVLLIAFAIGIFTEPMKIGLIAFASAVMIGILLYLNKYRRDMGKSVFALVQQTASTS